MEITIYTGENCIFCTRAKQLLNARGLRYHEISLAMDDAGRELLLRRTGRMSFPQLLIDCEPIGGYTELAEFVQRLR